jgi:hypothetical protein
MKTIVIVTTGLVAMLSVAAAADLPRREPPPPAAAPIGKYPVGKYPVGKYPQPVVTKGWANRRLFVKASTPTRSWFTTLRVRRPLELFQFTTAGFPFDEITRG